MNFWLLLMVVALLVALVFVTRRLVRRPSLEIGERGIRDRGLGHGWIPWDEIEGAYPPSAESADTLRLRLRLTDRLARTLRRRRIDPGQEASEAGSVVVPLDLSRSELDPLEVLERIMGRSRGR